MDVCDAYSIVQLFFYSCLLFLLWFFFIFFYFPLLGSVWIMNPMMRSLNLLKIDLWFGLFKTFPVISPLGHHFTDISCLWILWVRKTILCWYICCVYCLMNCYYFLEKLRSHCLDIWHSQWLHTSEILKILVQSTYGISWLTPTIFDLVEILLLSFCLLDAHISNPYSIFSPPPVCPLILGCTAYDPLI